jgi:hypothetical protein
MRLVIIYNDDEKVLDYLSDLENRTPIIMIDKALKEDKTTTICLLDNHKKEGIITLVLANAPFDFNEGDNILMLFAHDSIDFMIGYFKRMMEDTDYKEKDQREALLEIILMLRHHTSQKSFIDKPQTQHRE